MTRVITIAREYGSGGGSIARILSQKLGWKLLDRDLISQLATLLHCSPEEVVRYDEHSPSFVSRLLHAYSMGSADTWSAPPSPEILDEDRLATITGQLIREAAQLGGCIIVGRGSQCLLRDRTDVFQVFVYAPQDERVHRLLQRHATKHEAEAAMVEVDGSRAAYVHRYYRQEWTNRQLYDLMTNSRIGDSNVAETILTAAGLTSARV